MYDYHTQMNKSFHINSENINRNYNFWILVFIGFLYGLFFIGLKFCKNNQTLIIKNNYQYLLESPPNYIFNFEYIDNVKNDSSPLIMHLDDFCKINGIYQKGAIVSLSGGVDSMVMLAILIYLQKTHEFPIYTATIDYGLRDESNDESEFLKKYVKMFNIKSYVSYIREVSRKKESSGSRSEFEEESRNLRFNTYKKIIQENNLDPNIGIFVAHHQDDIIENIFTNALKGGNLLDLEVMKPISKIHEVNIHRPFLEFKKQVIYDFAHLYNVPYFLDTTPTWSKRGKMRNEIFPLLDNVFGIDWHNKLKYIGTQSLEWGEYINSYIIDPWLSRVIVGSSGIIIPIENQPKLIYSSIITKSLHKIGENMIKKSSLDKIMNLIIKKSHNVISLDGTRYALLVNYQLLVIINIKKIKKNNDNKNWEFYYRLINGEFNISTCSDKNLNKLFR